MNVASLSLLSVLPQRSTPVSARFEVAVMGSLRCAFPRFLCVRVYGGVVLVVQCVDVGALSCLVEGGEAKGEYVCVCVYVALFW